MENHSTLLNTVRDFVKWARPQLGIRGPIRVRLRNQALSGSHVSFGGFDTHTSIITVSIGDRHEWDILRTLGHELVHLHQSQLQALTSGDGATGSDVENQANAFAGVLMRNWADRYRDGLS
jgi:hypothetical protein